MNSTISTEKQLQNNVINLLKFIFIFQEDNVSFGNEKLSDVLLKDILVNQLQKLNSLLFTTFVSFSNSKRMSWICYI